MRMADPNIGSDGMDLASRISEKPTRLSQSQPIVQTYAIYKAASISTLCCRMRNIEDTVMSIPTNCANLRNVRSRIVSSLCCHTCNIEDTDICLGLHTPFWSILPIAVISSHFFMFLCFDLP
jgi:hypothetical protein